MKFGDIKESKVLKNVLPFKERVHKILETNTF